MRIPLHFAVLAAVALSGCAPAMSVVVSRGDEGETFLTGGFIYGGMTSQSKFAFTCSVDKSRQADPDCYATLRRADAVGSSLLGKAAKGTPGPTLRAQINGAETKYATVAVSSEDASEFIESPNGPLVAITDPDTGVTKFKRGNLIKRWADKVSFNVTVAELEAWSKSTNASLVIKGMDKYTYELDEGRRKGIADLLAKLRLATQTELAETE